jgi:hypothetical protein
MSSRLQAGAGGSGTLYRNIKTHNSMRFIVWCVYLSGLKFREGKVNKVKEMKFGKGKINNNP